MQTDNTQQCAHKVYSVDPATGNGHCLKCFSRGKMRFVMEEAPQAAQKVLDAMQHLLTPQQRTWVGLTEEEVEKIYRAVNGNEFPLDFYVEIEAKLKEKNGL